MVTTGSKNRLCQNSKCNSVFIGSAGYCWKCRAEMLKEDLESIIEEAEDTREMGANKERVMASVARQGLLREQLIVDGKDIV